MKSGTTIDEFLSGYFASVPAGSGDTTALEADLREFIEIRSVRAMSGPQRAIVSAERQFNPTSAYSKNSDVKNLVPALAAFIGDSGYIPDDDDQRGVQLFHAQEMAVSLTSGGVIDSWECVCDLHDLRHTLNEAMATLAGATMSSRWRG